MTKVNRLPCFRQQQGNVTERNYPLFFKVNDEQMDHEYKEPYKLKLKKLDLEKQQEFHQISCPSCQTGIPASDLNINDKIAKCNSCNVVFSFQGTVNQLFTNI